jgi:adenylosuccinate synthase
MIEYADIVADLSWGDTGKGKVTSALVKESEYDFVCRWAGGNNAGHTVFVNGKKYKTHLIPSGVFHGVMSIIGPGCVVHENSLMRELKYLEENGFDISKVRVSPRAHIVSRLHIDEDIERLSEKLGTTSKGIAPCYADKMARKGTLAKDVLPYWMMWDEKLHGKVLCEGAQGFYLDVDQGNYPYVTSSTTLPYGACSLGFPPQKIRRIYGTCKAYDTRSGVDPMFPEELLNDPELLTIADKGQEFGVTTGRRRKVNWLNLDLLIKAANVSGATNIIVNKVDILIDTGVYKLFHQGAIRKFEDLRSFTDYITQFVKTSGNHVDKIIFSKHPEII